MHCYALLSFVTHWKMSRSPISCRFWSRAYIKMQKIHKIIASLTGSFLLHIYLSWVPSFGFRYFFRFTIQMFGNNAISGTQVAALFIGMMTERGYPRRAWESVRKLAKRDKASIFVGKHESPSSKRNKACQSLMKASDLVSDLQARS